MALRPITDPALLAKLNAMGGGGPQPVQIAPANPKLPGEVVGQDLSNQGKRIDNQSGAALLPWQVRKAKADALAAEADLVTKRRPSLTPARQAELTDKLTALRNMENQLGKVEGLYKKDLAGQPMSRAFGLGEYFPLPSMQEFDKAAKQMGPYVMSALGMSGKATDAAAEYERKVMPFIPSSRSTDTANETTLSSLHDMLENQYRSTYSELGKPYRPKPRAKVRPSTNDGWKIEEVR